MATDKLNVQGKEISLLRKDQQDFISLTDMARDFAERAELPISNWIRNRNTLEFLGLWEQLHNPKFKPLEFEGFKKQAGLNSFYLSPTQWVEATGAIGIEVRRGRYGGTYAHVDIAMEFGSWLSPSFKLYLIKDFQRLQLERRESLEWDVRRILTKVNFRIHTDAVRLQVPRLQWNRQLEAVHQATEADLLNLVVFGTTAKQWRQHNADKKGNIRDYAHPLELVVLANMETLNAEYLREGLSKDERYERLVKAAEFQRSALTNYYEDKLKGK